MPIPITTDSSSMLAGPPETMARSGRRSAESVLRGSLVKAFQAFSEAAGSLESSYSQLQSQVTRLRSELSLANADLTRSLDENRNMRAYLMQLLESLLCGVVVMDSRWKVKIANPAALHILEELHLPSQASAENTLERFMAALPARISEGVPEFDLEVGAGRNRIISVARACLLRGAAGGEDNVFILRDTTEQKQLELERENNGKIQALADMAMTLAHEIRNPLASLELFAGLLAGAVRRRPVMRQWVEHLQAGLRTLSATVNNVLQFHSRPAVAMVSLNIARLLRETADFLEPLARQKGLALRLTVRDSNILVAADAHRLQQVFFNLAMNSFRAMPRGTALQMRVRRREDEPGSVEIEFEDQGPGIAPENVEHIFQAGFTTTPCSSGLGLAVCKNIVEQHGGTIRVAAEAGEGAKFVITLPVSGAV